MRLGIDFGTTRTVITAADRGNYPVVSFTAPDGDWREWWPTVVAEDRGRLYFGFEAESLARKKGAVVVRSFKRLLSDEDASPAKKVRIGSLQITLMDLVTGFLEALRSDLVERSNVLAPRGANERIDVVIATPAHAHSAQRFITLEAFSHLGFRVLAMLNEPSAAGVEYAHRYKKTITAQRENVLVYDLGGGTFDASLVQIRGRTHSVLASSGLAKLGGDDFDQRLLELVLAERGIPPGQLCPASFHRLIEHCRELKESLGANSRRIAVELGACLEPEELEGLEIGEEHVVALPTESYYQACEPLVEATFSTMLEVMAGDDSLERVAGIYVVGGASAMPAVARTLRERFGRRVHRSAYPSASVAMGLAIAFDEGSTYEMRENFSRNFGVFREARDGASVAFDPIFTPGTEIPLGGDEPRVHMRTYRSAHNVGHFRYVECSKLDEEGVPCGDITPFAEVLFPFDRSLRDPSLDLRAVPIARVPERGALIRETYSLSAGGVVELVITDLDSGYERRHALGRA